MNSRRGWMLVELLIALSMAATLLLALQMLLLTAQRVDRRSAQVAEIAYRAAFIRWALGNAFRRADYWGCTTGHRPRPDTWLHTETAGAEVADSDDPALTRVRRYAQAGSHIVAGKRLSDDYVHLVAAASASRLIVASATQWETPIALISDCSRHELVHVVATAPVADGQELTLPRPLRQAWAAGSIVYPVSQSIWFVRQRPDSTGLYRDDGSNSSEILRGVTGITVEEETGQHWRWRAELTDSGGTARVLRATTPKP